MTRAFVCAVSLASLCWWGSAAAQGPQSAQNAASSAEIQTVLEMADGMRPLAKAARIAQGQAPTIDADLSDPIWEQATILTDFRQREPNPRAPPTERTVLRLMYDDDNFYFSVYAYDSQPDLVIVRSMSRDGEMNQGDHIEITLDPGFTLRNAYTFRIGPSGGRWDGLRLNNVLELPEWNTIWQASARRVPDGWVAEIVIPFRSIAYVPGQTNWGFDFTRMIRRRTEIVRWSSFNPALPITDVSEAGTLTDIRDVNMGIGLDVVPFVVFRAKHDWSLPDDGAGLTATMGGNAFYKITPGLTGTATLNTDFSDTPLDIRVVNTSRFSLFFPETRAFFLQDAGSFEFGGRAFRRTNADRENTNAMPFFSRTIGLADGRPTGLVGGGKISGQYGGLGIGALSVMSKSTPGIPGQILSVARVTAPLFSQSRAGFIVTNGDPTGRTENTLAGADFQYRTDSLFGGKAFQTDVYYQRSFSSAVGQDASYGAGVYFPNEPFGVDMNFKTVGQNFAPALGFVNRPAVRIYDGTFRYVWRFRGAGNFFRTIVLDTVNIITTNLDGRVDTRNQTLQVQFTTTTDHQLYVTMRNNFDRLLRPFTLPGNVDIPMGAYTWNTFNTHFQISRSRPVSFHMDTDCCDYYNGSQLRVSPDIRIRPSEYLELNASYDAQFIRLPTGNVDIHVFTLDGQFNFTPNMQFAMQAQYDNISQRFGFLGRYRWEYRPGNEIFAALGQAAVVPTFGQVGLLQQLPFRLQATTFSIRFGNTLRF